MTMARTNFAREMRGGLKGSKKGKPVSKTKPPMGRKGGGKRGC